MPRRKSISPELIASVLVASRRRCCVCFALTNSSAEKKGQIAHLDHDPSNNFVENLVFLCLDHHDQYDSRSSQSKGLTVEEIRRYRTQLEESITRPVASDFDKSKAEMSSVWHQKRIEALVAIYEAFRAYLDFLRRALYIPETGLSLDPMWDLRKTVEKNMVYLNEALLRDIQRFSGELLEFWNWAYDQARPGGIDDADLVQKRLDYEIPGYLEKLRQVINSYADPHFRIEDREAQPVAPPNGGTATQRNNSRSTEGPQ